MKKKDPEIEKFFSYIRKRSCSICESGHWDEDLGCWANSVSHITPKGSQHRDFHKGNVVSMCIPCHSKYEVWPRVEKEKFRALAEHYVKCWEVKKCKQ